MLNAGWLRKGLWWCEFGWHQGTTTPRLGLSMNGHWIQAPHWPLAWQGGATRHAFNGVACLWKKRLQAAGMPVITHSQCVGHSKKTCSQEWSSEWVWFLKEMIKLQLLHNYPTTTRHIE
jgi:hypothetical protein